MSETYIKRDFEVKTDPLTKKPVFFHTYEWAGDGSTVELNYTDLHREMVENPGILAGDVITLGGLRLRIIDHSSYGPYLVVARDGWKAYIIKALWPVKKWWLWFWYRFILTLVVWGLAERQPGTIPDWRDIKVFKRFAK